MPNFDLVTRKKSPPFEGLKAGDRAKFVINRPVYVYLEKLQGCLCFSESKCLTAADSGYTFTHGEGKTLGTFFLQMIPNTLFNHQELA